ncbi:hypothetical protein M569_12069, partial [Genlisea aurea]
PSLSPIAMMIRTLVFAVLSVALAAVGNDLAVSSSSSNGNAMILPLFFNNRDRSRSEADAYPRRHLGNSGTPYARMPLHDDLLLNGYYTTRLGIGTPPQTFALIVDTGSTVTYVPCSTCKQCGNHQDPKFQPDLSSSYQPVKCNIDCTCDAAREQCTYERQYAEMSSSSGVLGEDVVSFGNQSDLEAQRAIFGCENAETGDLYSQHADGIIGLGRGDLSIVDQLVGKGVIADSFSLCYGGMDIGGGAMVLGGISPPPDMVFTRSDPMRSPYYNIELREIHVAGKKLPLNPDVFDGKHGTVLDSGTTYAYLPEEAFVAFKDAMIGELHSLKRVPGPDPNFNDICFSGAGNVISKLSKIFPAVEMVFSSDQKLSLLPENYMFRHSKLPGSYCLGIFQNGKDPTTLLGGIVVRNTLVTYDREQEKIGFWKTNCSELWERLHLSPPGAPPPPSDENTGNSTADITPAALPPTEPPLPPSPDMMRIGRIVFSMSSNLTYSELKSRLSELVRFLADELNVNAYQVKLTDFSRGDNGTLVTVAIYPAKSDAYLSNATATEILAKLDENGVHPPPPSSFGSCKFFGWKIEPPSKRQVVVMRLNGRYTAVVLTTVFVLVCVASAAWLVWRRRRYSSALSYKPVADSVLVPEQELQPL